MDYEDFRKQYEIQHPASVPQEEDLMGEYPQWVTLAVGLMFTAAAFFSGVHTVPVAHDAIENTVAEWIRQAGGVSAFLFIEVGVLVSAYMLVKRFSWAMLVILLVTIAVAMGANLYSVANAFDPQETDLFSKVITILFGLVAPTMAALSGGVFVWLHHADRTADARTKNKFREARIAWDKEIERAWKAFQRSSASSVQASNPVSNGQSTLSAASTVGHTKVPDASRVVRDYLDENPEAMELSPRQLAGILNVGKSTVNNVQRELRAQSNGHNGHAN